MCYNKNMNTNLSILSKQSTGILLIIGILGIFVITLTQTLSIVTVVGLLLVLFIIASFLYKPLFGFLTIVILRTFVDFFSSYFSLSITENIQLNIASIFALLLIVLSIIFIALYWNFIPKIYLIAPFLLFIGFSIISIFYSIDKTATIQEAIRLISIFLSFITAYILTLKISQAREIIVSTILISAIVPIMFAIYQFMTNSGITDSTGTEGRLFGTFTHPNAFASFLLLLVAILTYKIFAINIKYPERNFSKVLIFFVITILILTFSRGSWLALLIFFTIFSLIKAPKLLFIIFSFIVLLFFTSQTVHDRIEDIYNPPSNSSIRWRIKQWKNAISAWQLSPIYGYGSGTEIKIHEQELGFHAGNPYTHNDFIKSLQETGIIGFILFVFLILTTILFLIKQYHDIKKTDEKLFVLVVLLFFISEIVFGMSSNIWRGTAVEWLIWTLVASALSIEKTIPKLTHK